MRIRPSLSSPPLPAPLQEALLTGIWELQAWGGGAAGAGMGVPLSGLSVPIWVWLRARQTH